MDVIFWVIMLAYFAWNMYDGGAEAINEWWWLRQARKEIRMMEAAKHVE